MKDGRKRLDATRERQLVISIRLHGPVTSSQTVSKADGDEAGLLVICCGPWQPSIAIDLRETNEVMMTVWGQVCLAPDAGSHTADH